MKELAKYVADRIIERSSCFSYLLLLAPTYLDLTGVQTFLLIIISTILFGVPEEHIVGSFPSSKGNRDD